MKLKLVDYQSYSDTESDYDTAVDLAHYTMQDLQYIFETSNNTTIILCISDTTTTKSYLEPDFNEIEQDFKKGEVKDNYQYHSQPSEQEPESSKTFRMEFVVPGEITSLTVEEMESYIKYFKLAEQYNIENIDPYNCLDRTLYHKLAIYQEDECGVPDHCISLNINKEQLDDMLNKFPQNFKEGDVIDITLHQNIERQINDLENEKEKILLDNEIFRKSNQENYDQAIGVLETKKLATVLENATNPNKDYDNKLTENTELETKSTILSKLRKMFK